jgi:glycine hydroxymethyltransferase
MTTLGMKEEQMRLIAGWIIQILKIAQPQNDLKTGEKSKTLVSVEAKILNQVRVQVKELLEEFPLYPELIIE